MTAPPELQERIRALPEQPGVYMFKDDTGEILYVGKSVSLRSRVRSYFGAPRNLSPKTRELVARITDFETILTDSELEALVLEATLIKKHLPRYNIRLRDDKAYPYIKVTLDETWPRIVKTRRIEDDGGRYFGPFTNVGSVNETLRLLNKLFPYCAKERPVRERDRPCLDYYLNRCLGPCAGKADPQEYADAVRQAILFLEGRGERILKQVQKKMERAAEELQFERAAVLRDQLAALEQVLERQKVVSTRPEDEDIIAIARDNGESCAQVFFIRRGRLIGSEHFVLQGTEEEEPARIMTSFVSQFYGSAAQVPRRIVLQHEVEEKEVLAQWLRQKRGGAVELRVPQRGEKRRLVELVARNAAQRLEQMRIRWLSQKQLQAGALAELRDMLELPGLPRRIEGYDISTLYGQAAVGSMVVFEDGAPKSSHYRRFRIRDVEGQDDYAMMREVLQRRFRRSQEQENGTGGWTDLPDLVLIDGGRGQLGVALEVLREAGLSEIPAVGLAKKEEALYLPGRVRPLHLPRDSVALFLLQRVRDEAHRFAVTYHRTRRRKESLTSQLEEVPGIGPRRRSALMRHFGSVKAVRQASVEELAAVPGMNRTVAQRLKDYLA